VQGFGGSGSFARAHVRCGHSNVSSVGMIEDKIHVLHKMLRLIFDLNLFFDQQEAG